MQATVLSVNIRFSEITPRPNCLALEPFHFVLLPKWYFGKINGSTSVTAGDASLARKK